MASSINEFLDIIENEVLVDMNKLRSSSKHGIPDEVRAKVWLCLLSIQATDNSKDERFSKEVYQRYKTENSSSLLGDTLKRLRGDCSRYQKSYLHLKKPDQPTTTIKKPHSRPASPSSSHSNSPPSLKCRSYSSTSGSVSPVEDVAAGSWQRAEPLMVSGVLENVIGLYLGLHRGVEYSSRLVNLCGPFWFGFGSSEEEVFFCFEAFLGSIDCYFEIATLQQRISNFLMLFRNLLPELYSHLEEEEVDLHQIFTNWFRNFLSRELPMSSLLRLWDTYFSLSEGLEMHTFVCLALLSALRESLEEFDQGEIVGCLSNLPVGLDMDQVIAQAFTLRSEMLEVGY